MGDQADDAVTPWPPMTGADAQREAMPKLRRALLRRRDNQAEARAWDGMGSRNHFGPSIEKVMRIGRENAGR